MKLKFLPSNDYIRDLNEAILETPHEIVFTYFHISAEEMFNFILPSIKAAIKNGTKLTFNLDYEFSSNNLGVKVWKFLHNKEERENERIARIATKEVFAELEKLGAKFNYNYINRNIVKLILPTYKSDHRKIVIVTKKDGTKLAYFGGVNLDDGGKNDFMIRVDSHDEIEIVNKVSECFDPNIPKDNFEALSKDKRFIGLFDVGLVGRSIILDKSARMLKKAQKQVVYVNQLPPEISMLKNLIPIARKGVDVEIVLPNKNDFHLSSFPYNVAFLLSRIILKFSRSKINVRHIEGYTHSKILIVDDTVLTGSSNLSLASILSGVREFSAIINDPQLISEIKDFINNL